MVQILNKMVHLKSPILEICYCPAHSTQLRPPILKFDSNLRKIFSTNSAALLCTSHSHMENMENTAPNFDCLFQPIKCKHLNPRFLATFGTCYSSQMLFSRPKVGKRSEEYVLTESCSVALHKSLLQEKYVEYCICKF